MLANAAGPDTSNANVELVLIGAAVFLVVSAIGFLPIMVSRSMRPRKNESIIAAVVLWGLITGCSVIYTVMQQMNWSAELNRRVDSGYYDPHDAGKDAPTYPVVFWAAMTVAYGAILFWSSRSPAMDLEKK